MPYSLKEQHMTGYQSKKAAAQAKLEDDDDIQTYMRPWVGLSNGEMIELSEMQLGSWDLILEVEAKLKEKNNAT
jgi:hypothetical protein